MIIKYNAISLNTYNNFARANKSRAKNAEKLSSGLRINRASDDAAGLAISEKMKAQIRGLNQAQRNIQDGISLVQTVESALEQIETTYLLRMKELTVQASTGTLADIDRTMIQNEMRQLINGIEDIADNTDFNGIKLLDGSNIQINPGETNLVAVDSSITGVTGSVAAIIFDLTENLSQSLVIGIAAGPFTGTSYNAMFTFENPPSNPNFISTPLGSDTSSTLDNIILTLDNIKNDTSGDPLITAHKNFMNDNNVQISRCGIDVLIFTSSPGTSFTGITGGPDGSDIMPGSTWVIMGHTAHFTYHELQTIPPTTSSIDTILQVGPNCNDIFKITLPNAKASNLGINNIDVTKQADAQNAIVTIDQAIDLILAQRSKFGAYQNALEHISNNVIINNENLTSSESRIRDADMAKEMLQFLRYNISQEVSQVLLTQANQVPESILSLLSI